MLLLFTLAAMIGAAVSQANCPLPDASTIGTLLEMAVVSEGGEASVTVILINSHFTCLAVGDRAGLFRSISVAVNYTQNQESIERLAQLQLECSSGGTLSVGTLEKNVDETVFSLATRRDCRLCTHTRPGPMKDTDANCACELSMASQSKHVSVIRH